MSSWKETSAGTFTKPANGLQKFFVQMCNPDMFGGRENALISMTVKLELQGQLASDDFVRSLQQAWKGLRFQIPAIAMEIDGTNTIYRVPDAQALEEWLSTSLHVHHGEPEAWFVDKETTRSTELHYFPDTSSISFVVSHWLSDFDGMLMIIQEFLKQLVNPNTATLTWGEEAARLRPSFDEMAGIRDEPDPETKAFIEKMYKAAYDAGENAGLPTLKDVPIGKPAFASFGLSSGSTSEVLKTCKTMGYSVATAFHAAYVLATWEFAPEAGKELPQSLVLLRDMRRIVGPPLDGPEYAACPCQTVQIATVAKSRSFAVVASTLQPAYRLGVEDKAKLLAGAKENNKQALAWAAHSFDPNCPPMSLPVMNSIGLIEPWMAENYVGSNGTVKVTDFAVRLTVLVPHVLSWVYSFAGRLHINVAYNEANFEASLVRSFFLRMMEILGEGLGIKVPFVD